MGVFGPSPPSSGLRCSSYLSVIVVTPPPEFELIPATLSEPKAGAPFLLLSPL